MSPIVFISYSAKDEVLASAIHGFLNNNGVKALKAPDDIAPGTNWAAAITEMIERCTHMVLVWTSKSMASQEVSKELTLAMQCGAVIIPFRSEDLAPEGAWRYHLSQVQWLEAHAMPEGQALETLLSQVCVGSYVDVPSAQTLSILLGVVEKSRPWDDLLELVSR
ncbi:MAG: toll/interleukin-1 receptor domain-containing protein [Cyanobacteria bacterium K_Offshore_0m_m2_072]|nr:toll/interleukin-1 receptor domain-containing protein [Cyanobacteria bacterium K_Offshore_0m_m2_072]